MYVPFELSMATARRMGAARTRVTNEYHHDGIRAYGAAVLDKLLELARR